MPLRLSLLALATLLALAAASCGASEPEVVEKIVEVPVEKVVVKEVPVEVVVQDSGKILRFLAALGMT